MLLNLYSRMRQYTSIKDAGIQLSQGCQISGDIHGFIQGDWFASCQQVTIEGCSFEDITSAEGAVLIQAKPFTFSDSNILNCHATGGTHVPFDTESTLQFRIARICAQQCSGRWAQAIRVRCTAYADPATELAKDPHNNKVNHLSMYKCPPKKYWDNAEAASQFANRKTDANYVNSSCHSLYGQAGAILNFPVNYGKVSHLIAREARSYNPLCIESRD